MPKVVRTGTAVALALAAALLLSLTTQAQQVPKELQPPANEELLLQVHAEGKQIYLCKAAADGQFAWTLKAPEAQLFDKNGKPFGKHFEGPSWEANDGSLVTGKAVANVPSPDPGSIPWLLVTVINHGGDGVLSRVTSIQRINTKGGQPPSEGCDSARVGTESRPGYSADYRFFVPK